MFPPSLLNSSRVSLNGFVGAQAQSIGIRMKSRVCRNRVSAQSQRQQEDHEIVDVGL